MLISQPKQAILLAEVKCELYLDIHWFFSNAAGRVSAAFLYNDNERKK
jgi:hypothetical protein